MLFAVCIVKCIVVCKVDNFSTLHHIVLHSTHLLVTTYQREINETEKTRIFFDKFQDGDLDRDSH